MEEVRRYGQSGGERKPCKTYRPTGDRWLYVWRYLEQYLSGICLSKKIDDINDWINDSQIQRQYQEADEVMKESERLVEQKRQWSR